MRIGRLLSLIVTSILISVVAIPIRATSQSPLALPAGWRLPTQKEANQAWRSSAATRYLVEQGDFTGDGRQDSAYLLVRADGSGVAPFVGLTRRDGVTLYIQGEETNHIEYLENEGLKIAKPGTYTTACGKGYGCSPGDKESITISHDAIEFFKREGPSRLIYWDAARKVFAETWLSD